MDSSIFDFLKIFSSDSSNPTIEENFTGLIVKTNGNNFQCPLLNELSEKIVFLNKRDKLKISIKIGSSNPVIFYSGNNNLNDFIANCHNAQSITDKSNYSSEIEITKEIQNNIISVYSLCDFYEYLSKLSLESIFYTFNKYFDNKVLILESQTDFIGLETSTICFCSIQNNKELNIDSKKRKDRTDLTISICNYNLLAKYDFIPDDFRIISKTQTIFTDLFNKLSTFLSIAYLFDVTIVSGSEIATKLNGYKSISCKINFSELSALCFEEYYQIYNWCYVGGNFTDKIGLARNIVSLHLENNSITYSGSPFTSIKSSYIIYEKQNIKQYIEIRNKITDQLLDFKNKADKIIENFAGDFKKSLFGFISFFASIIVIQVLRNGNFFNVFTTDTTLLSIAFLSISLIFLYASRWELKKQKERYVQSYNNLKRRYEDLLNSEDIIRILNNDKDHKDDVSFIDSKLIVYSRLWKGTVIIFMFIIVFLYSINNIIFILDFLKKIHLCYCK